MNLSNHFLLAMPTLADPHFDHTLIYLCEHNENGAMGLILNRKMPLQLGDVFEQLDIETDNSALAQNPVLYGGPIDPERGFVLHSLPGQWQATLDTGFGLGVTSSRDILEDLARGEGPQACMIMLGYAGWAPGQLEHEITENSWLSCPADTQIMFQVAPEQRLAAAAARLGVDMATISSDAGHA
jgi:putative transcriptional regulator